MTFNETQGACSCGKNHFSILNQPVGRFICHCTICQKYTGNDYSDVLVFLKRDIANLNITDTEFKRHKLPPNIRRGLCRSCHKPSIEFGLLDQYAFIPASNIQNLAQFAPASIHIFYHRRVKEIHDNLPKYNGFISSQLMVSNLIIHGVYQHLTQ